MGFDLGLERAGMKCRWQVEIDPWCQKVLAKHWPDVKRYGDIRDVGKHNLEPVDVICGGFPCQDVSLAGLQAGLEGERSSLWKEFARIICEIGPRWVLVENVRGLFSANDGRFFGTILRTLAGSGYDAEWQVLPASLMGAPHERERVYIVAYSNKEHGKAGMGDKSDGTPQIFGSRPAERFAIWLQTPRVNHRVDDGLPSWFYELAVGAYGNAVVPQVVEWLGRRIRAAQQQLPLFEQQ